MATKNEMPEKVNKKPLGTLGKEVEINTFKTTGRLRKWWFHISDKKKTVSTRLCSKTKLTKIITS